MRLQETSSAGFTVVELLVVMGITALILASILAARPRAASARLDATARSVTSTLQLARARAITTNTDAIVRIDAIKHEFGMANEMHKIPKNITIALKIAESERSGDIGGIRYYPDGQSSGGEVLLVLEGRTARIAVNWLTGEPRLIR